MSTVLFRRLLTSTLVGLGIAGAAVLAWSVWPTTPEAGEAGAAAFAQTIALARPDVDDEIAALARQAPDEQAPAFRDGAVDLGEYRSAVSRVVTCIEQQAPSSLGPAHRVVVHGPVVSADSFAVSYSYEVLGPLADTTPLQQLERTCQERHLRQIEQAYQLSLLADQRYMDRQARRFQECVDAAGLTVNWARGNAALSVLEQVKAGGEPGQREEVIRCAASTPSVNAGIAAAR